MFELQLNFDYFTDQKTKCFLYYLHENTLFDIVIYKQLCVDIANIIEDHKEKNIFDNVFLANLINISRGIQLATFDYNNIDYYLEKKYSNQEFNNILENTIWEGNSFVDFTNLYFYLLRDYCLRSDTDNFKYIYETIPDVNSFELK